MMQYQILQVYPTIDFHVYLYFNDGSIRKFDAHELIRKGVFQPLQDINIFQRSCTVIHGTLAWDLAGKRDPSNVLDLDAQELYRTCPVVADPLSKTA